MYLTLDIWDRKGLSRTTILNTEQKEEKSGTVTRRNKNTTKHSKKRIVIENIPFVD